MQESWDGKSSGIKIIPWDFEYVYACGLFNTNKHQMHKGRGLYITTSIKHVQHNKQM